MVILEESKNAAFNPASLAVTYANMRVLKNCLSVSDIPRITFIHLGLHKQPLNKSFIYMNTIPKKVTSSS